MVFDEKAIFVAALEVPDANARETYLQDVCGDHPELLDRLRKLLSAHAGSHGPLDRLPAALGSTLASAYTAAPGMVIGPYKLIEEVGEGGMATVWMAQQTEPVKRLVAVKLIKAGMDSKQVIARFEAERQALALMDHPNIARVLDAGTTDTGRPYFVMDLVKGVPITRYCDEHRLTLRQRLELFIPVCQAIQHAHQKGIIHRDLKPSNVLVALHDSEPVPKVIDFGVAKAVGQQLTDRTLVTGFGAIVGTLEYMSPEQASFNQLDVDTRSDVYSLGVLLYELLTGSPPDSERQTEAVGLIETLRVIREQVPLIPSTRLSTAGGLPALAADRGTEPAKLTKLVRGELDWIAMKALEKDRNRRYETANGLAMDLQNYLADEPVQACPPSAGYRLRRFARRNKGAVLAVAAIFLLLVAGITGTSWGVVRAERAWEAEATQRKLAEDAVVSERAAKKAEAEERSRAESALAKAAREAAVAAAINEFLNKDILQLSDPSGQVVNGISPDANLKLRTVLQRAGGRLEGKFPNEPEVEMRLRTTIGYALISLGDHAGALAQYQKAVSLSRQLQGRNHPFTLNAEYRLAVIHRNLGHRDLAVRLLEENVERHKAILGQEHPQTFIAMNGLSMAYHAKGLNEKALQLAEQTLEMRKRYLGPNHADTLVSMNNVAWLYQELNQAEKALSVFVETLAGMQTKLAPLHPERINTTANLARAYHAAEQIDKAVPLQEAVVQQFKTAYGLDDSRTQILIDRLIAYYVEIGWCDKAEIVLKSIQAGGANRPTNVSERQAQREKGHRDLIERVRPSGDKYLHELAAKKEDHPDTQAARFAFAIALRQQRRNSGAAFHVKPVLIARERLLGASHPDTLACRLELGTIRLQQRQFAEAETLLSDYRAVRQKQAPDDWITFYAQSLHGAALVGLKKLAEAEPLLLESQAALRKRESEIPDASKSVQVQTLQRLVQLYDSWHKKEKADEWRRKLPQPKK